MDSLTPGLVVCALAREADYLLPITPQVRFFGPGKYFAGAFHSYLSGHAKPAWALLAGLSGSLQPTLRPGDLILAQKVLGPKGEEFVSPLAKDLHQAGVPLNIRTGVIYHSEVLVDDPAHKKALGGIAPHFPLAVDMESAAFASICDSLGVPWGILRVIFDTMDDSLPPGMADWCGSDGRENTWRIATRLLFAPQWWVKIPAWIRTSKTCGDRLTQGVGVFLNQLDGQARTKAAVLRKPIP